jgi:hypothetical protein
MDHQRDESYRQAAFTPLMAGNPLLSALVVATDRCTVSDKLNVRVTQPLIKLLIAVGRFNVVRVFRD